MDRVVGTRHAILLECIPHSQGQPPQISVSRIRRMKTLSDISKKIDMVLCLDEYSGQDQLALDDPISQTFLEKCVEDETVLIMKKVPQKRTYK